MVLGQQERMVRDMYVCVCVCVCVCVHICVYTYIHTHINYLFLTMESLHCYVWPFSSCGEWGLLSSCGTQASHCGGCSC